MTTTWIPRTTFDQPRQWLLANGEVVSEPPLEQTSTGRKVRVAGAPHLSAFSRDINDLVTHAVRSIATAKQTSVWMALSDREDAMARVAGFKPDDTQAKLFLLNGSGDKQTIAWWKFKHPTLPVEALLYVVASHQNSYHPSQGQRIKTVLVTPKTIRGEIDLNAQFYKAENPWLGPLMQGAQEREWLRDNPPEWPNDMLGEEHIGSERAMVKKLLERVRQIEDLDEIQIPDLRDQYADPEWLSLELYETNVHSGFVTDLVDYLEGGSSIEEAVRIYSELRDCMRGIGVYLSELTENDFHRGLLGSEKQYVTVGLGKAHEDIDKDGSIGRDDAHTLRMHLPTGTFVVDCDHAAGDLNKVAEAWDEAKTIASLTGEEDVLIAYARAKAQEQQNGRAKKILNQRKQILS